MKHLIISLAIALLAISPSALAGKKPDLLPVPYPPPQSPSTQR